MDRVSVSPMVCWAGVDELIVILDLTTQTYQLLDETATLLWNAIHDHAGVLDSALRELQHQYPADRDGVTREFDRFVGTCLDRDYLRYGGAERCAAGPPSERTTARRHLLAMRAWWCMLRISGALRVRGFSAAYLRVRDEAARDVDARRAPALSKAVSSFLSAENVFWRRRGQQDCLPRSLALFLFLRRAGIRVEHKIGARRVPTVAIHAWVEYDGRGILEGSRDLTAYTQLAAIS
jgi:hypothetical protein